MSKILFRFFKKNRFWKVDALERGWGGGGVQKSVQKSICEYSLHSYSSIRQQAYDFSFVTRSLNLDPEFYPAWLDELGNEVDNSANQLAS